MKNYVLFTLVVLFSTMHKSFSQNLTTAFRIGADYNQTYLVVEELLGPSNIGSMASVWGYRAGVSLDAKIYKSWSIDSELGYSRGGFDIYKHTAQKRLNQLYLSITPQYSIHKFIKLKGGLLLNYNFKSEDYVVKLVEPLNYGITAGITGSFNQFELGFRYTHHLNPYFSYKKLGSIYDDGKEYWKIYNFFIGFKLWKSK